MGLFLGLDVGGTRSRWAWLDLGRTQEKRGGIQAAGRSSEEAAGVLAGLLAEVRGCHPDRVPDLTVIGMAGAGHRATAEGIERCLGRAGVQWPVVVVGDTVVAAAAALAEGPGVALWSGTGSFAVGRSAGGGLHRVGGRGYLIGDLGSAYDMVRGAGVAAVSALDGLGPETGLIEVLVQAFSSSCPSQLGPAMQRRSVGDLAGCFPMILECAARGDEVALGVLRRGAGQLAALALAAAGRSGLKPGVLALYLGGGVLETRGLFTELLEEELQAVGVERPPRGVDGAALGGAILARALHGGEEPMCRWVESSGTA
jgi:N-acetylglucosamine kinase-like BadF-type ATPase